MPIRLSGLASGLDTEAIVGALVSAYSYKKDKYVKAQTKLSWKQDAWKTLNSKVYSLYTSVGQMRYSSNYSVKKATVSDSTKATASASGTAINGTQSLKINTLARTAYVTGGELDSSVTGSTTLSSLGIKTGDATGNAKISVRTGTSVTNIELDSTMTINQFVTKLKEAGVEANFDENNHRFFISSKTSGKAGDFSISASNTLGLTSLIKMGLLSDSEIDSIESTASGSELVKKQYGTFLGTASGFASMLSSMKSYKEKISAADEIINSDTATEEEKAAAQEEKETLENEYATESSFKYLDEYLDEKGIDITTYTDEQITELGETIYTDEAEYTESAAQATKEEITTAINAIRDANVNLAKANAMSEDTDEEKAAKEAAIAEAKAEVDAAWSNETYAKWGTFIQDNFGAKDSEDATGNYNYTKFWSQSDNLELANTVFYRVDLAANIASDNVDLTTSNTAKKVDGVDAEIELNGVTYTNNTNSITVNGLTIEAQAVTTDEITVNVSNDTDALYDKVKDFLSSYNTLMNEMQSLYNADSAKDYEPLTEDEKAEMSETEIEKWEQKIKDSLLRRDTQLSGIISAMTMSMMSTYEINGKTYAWSTFGIHTLGTLNAEKNEGYAYHIDGDSEDSYTSGNEEKLRAALAEDPDTVIEFLKQVTTGLYKSLDDKMKSTAVKSVYTVYNDKEMASEYSEYSSLIKTWTERVQDMEDAYYKKFSAMEKALATLQGNSSSISSLLGG
ncbi:MAG: flagellar filament capping protein FliD [Pseudobutyrivibrio sp.]|nr:flagellar filament capping protein FliD [Pseudobutyrivibrio sp.]